MRRLSLLLLAATVGLLVVGCDTTGPALESGSGTLELRMTGTSSSKALATTDDPSDAATPSNIDSASVTITRAAIVSEDDSSEADSTEGGIEVLYEENFTVDLMDLQGGLDTLMAKIELDSGTYTQLRLITADQATVVFEDGTERDVMVASGQQTGFKVNFKPFTVDSPDDRVELTLAWDVANSLKGNRRGNLVITPAIQATVDTSGAGS